MIRAIAQLVKCFGSNSRYKYLANVATVLFSLGFLLHDDNKQPQQGSDGQLGVECQNPHFSKFFFVFHL